VTVSVRRPGRPQRALRLLGPLVPLLGYLALFFALPVALLLGTSFQDGAGHASLVQYQKLFGNDVYVRVLASTLKISFWVAVICVLVAYPIAYVIANARHKTQQALMLLVLLPFWTSFLIRTFAWIVLLGRKGVLNTWLVGSGVVSEPLPLLYNFFGVMVGMTHALLPIAVMTILPVMLSIDPALRKAGALLGGGSGQVFWRVYFPLSFPGVAAAWLLVFVSSLGFFITPALLGGTDETMVTQLIIQQVQQLLNWGFAGALSLLLLVSAGVIFFAFDRIVGVQALTQASTRSGTASRRASARLLGRMGGAICAGLGTVTDAIGAPFEKRTRGYRAHPPGFTVIAIVLVAFLILPTIFLIPVSFTGSSFLGWPPENVTWRWYQEYFGSSMWLTATLRSVIVAILSGLLAMALGVGAAFALSSERIPGRTGWLMLVLSPFFIPRIVVAVALFYLFAKLRLLDTSVGLILGHAVLGVPYVVITVMAVLNSYDHRLSQAAWTLGATRWQTLRRITLPIIRPGLVSAFLFAFVTSFDDVTLALFLSAGQNTTLPKQMWADATMQVSPLLAAVSTLVLIAVTALILIAEVMRARTRGIARSPATA
jgi:putative spermidine/putrescine transport system permease protein